MPGPTAILAFLAPPTSADFRRFGSHELARGVLIREVGVELIPIQ